MVDVHGDRVVCIEWAELMGTRPRHAGCNARLDEHGTTVRVPVARVTTQEGFRGFGVADLGPDSARALVGSNLADLFSHRGTTPLGRPLDFPLWDLVAKRMDIPVYQLAAQVMNRSVSDSLQVPCYDTSLYFDDLHLSDTESAANLLAAEAMQGYDRNHRNFKIKVGRGARHMPLEEGIRRDIAVVRAVRAAVGSQARLMIDANNGYNLNLAKRILAETAECELFWLEEAFHEDPVLYAELKEWLQHQGLSVRIADGEGEASPALLAWAEQGLVDVVQYDIFSYGFTAWLALGEQLDQWHVASAPHHYGRCLGNYVSAHLAQAMEGFAFVEWDEAHLPAVDASAYQIIEGTVRVPDLPGFGLQLDEASFLSAVEEKGFRVEHVD